MTTRNNVISFLKGILVFLVIWGHVVQCSSMQLFDFFQNDVFKTIYTFHMPAFMLISGYLFFFSESKKSFMTITKSKIRQLVIPIFSWTLVFFFFLNVLYSNNSYNLDFLKFCLDISWFLWSNLSSVVILLLANNLFKGKIKFLLYFLLIPINLLFPQAQLNLFMYPYFIIGYFFNKYNNSFKFDKKIFVILAVLIFIIMFPMFAKKHYIYTTAITNFSTNGIKGQLMIDMFRWLIGLTGSITFIVLFSKIYYIFKSSKLVSFTSKIGNYSLHLYLIQIIFISNIFPILYPIICRKLGFNILFPNLILYNLFFTPLMSIILLLFMYKVIKLISKIKFLDSILFGR